MAPSAIGMTRIKAPGAEFLLESTEVKNIWVPTGA